MGGRTALLVDICGGAVPCTVRATGRSSTWRCLFASARAFFARRSSSASISLRFFLLEVSLGILYACGCGCGGGGEGRAKECGH